MKRAIILGTLLALSSGRALAGEGPVVVELFTSQGCSSCPPANANLIELSKQPNVLALSFAVTYWDRLGWKDTFGREEYTARQYTYEPALGERGPFTPQMVVNGRVSLVGNRLREVEAAIGAAQPLAGPDVVLADGRVDIATSTAPARAADVWLVRYDPQVVEVPVGRGENTGRTLAHTHVVHSLERLGQWAGDAVSLPITTDAGGYSTAVLVQLPDGGPILSAVTD